MIDDEGNTLYTPVDDSLINSPAPKRWKIWLSATGLVSLMILVSLQGWIIDDVVDDIKKELGIYDRVPVWERSEWPYLTSYSNGYVMEYGQYDVLETENELSLIHI